MKRNYFILIIALQFFSCQKEISYQAPNSQVDVYVAGYVESDTTVETYPTYWKNGKAVRLNFDYGLQAAWANSIAVSGDDVYVAGYRVQWTPRNIITAGLLWKNDSAKEFGVGGGVELSSVVISNNDVYVVQRENLWPGTIAKYRKNDSLVLLVDNSKGCVASSLAVSGKDVYVAGTGRIGTDSDPVGIAM